MKMASTLLILIVVDRIAVSKIKPFRIYQAQQSDVHNMQTWKGVESSNSQDHFFISQFSHLAMYKKGVHQIVLSDTVVGNVASMDQPQPQ